VRGPAPVFVREPVVVWREKVGELGEVGGCGGGGGADVRGVGGADLCFGRVC